MSDETIVLTELPETPSGWTKRMVMHLNYGPDGGAATYSIHDEHGRRTNIGYAYDTRKSKAAPHGESGFFVNGSELMTWVELRRRYAELIAPPVRRWKADAGGALPGPAAWPAKG